MDIGDAPSAPRVADVLIAVVATGPRSGWPEALVEHCRHALGASGVGLAVTGPEGAVAVPAATPGVGQTGEDLQVSTGEGPCRLAAATGRMVQSPDLTSDPRWLQYAREATAAGICSAFSVPLRVGAYSIGVLDVYGAAPGPLAVDAVRALRVYADAATAILLLLTDQPPDAAGGADGGDAVALAEFADLRPVVHQAAGMVSVQLDVDPAQALLRMRGHAFAAGRTLLDVALDVVARRIGFDESTAGVHPRTRPTGPADPASSDDGG